MTGLDTHVRVRNLVQDDTAQSALTTRVIESLSQKQPGFVSHVVLAEMAWVLESCYDVGTAKMAEVVEALLRTEGLVVDQADVVWQTLRQFTRQHGDFADTLIAQLARQAGCTRVLTFDKRAAKRSGMTLLS